MPNTETAKKALRQNRKRRLINRTQRATLRTFVKKAREAIATSANDATATVTGAVKKLDQAAAKGLIHKNKAARLKSRMAKLAKSKAAPAS